MCIVCNSKKLFDDKFSICKKCSSKIIPHKKVVGGISWYNLFWYEGEYKNCVLASKTSKRDYFGKFFKHTNIFYEHKNKLWIPAPSSKNHLEKTLKFLGVRFENIFIKSGHSQKVLSGSNRAINSNKIELTKLPTSTSIVIFDDTTTSGSTINKMIELLGCDYDFTIITFCANQTKSI